MDAKPLQVEIIGTHESRQVRHVGDDLVPGDTTYELVLSFPNGRKHMATVSQEAFETYLDAAGLEHRPTPEPASLFGSVLTK